MKYMVWFVWVPSHCGNEGNERADSLTKNCNPDMLIEEVDVGYKQITQQHKINLISSWQQQWQSSDKGRFLYVSEPNVSLKPAILLQNFDKITQKIINRIKTGHGIFKQHLKRLNLVESDICDCNNSIETINHILWDCQHHCRTELI